MTTPAADPSALIDYIDKLTRFYINNPQWVALCEEARECVALWQSRETATTLLDGGVLMWKGQRFNLTPHQHRIVRALLDAAGLPVTYRDLHAAAYGMRIPHAHHEMTMRSQIKHLRHKLGDDCPIINHQGFGYSWQEPAMPAPRNHQ